MAIPGNQHCANCIGALLFPTQGNSDVILFRDCLCQLIFAAVLWVKTLRNVCHCDSA